MNSITRDPLLTAARFLIICFIIVMGVATVALVLTAPAVIIFQGPILSELAAKGVTASGELIAAATIVLLAVAALLALGIYFMILLRRIVNSVGEGDPFAPENAERLSRMGWIAVIGQAASIPVGGVVAWIAHAFAEASDKVHVSTDFGFSLSGLLLVFILFILARVFRHGTAMREDLEGTV